MTRTRHTTAVALAACMTACTSHYVIHPSAPPGGIATQREVVTRGPLRMHVEWARPVGEGPFATVVVHPEAGARAVDMRGVAWDLARHGYLSAAIDYERLENGRYRHTLFPWREEGDPVVCLDVVRAAALVDRGRIALLGFSQGGVFSLLIAAQTPDIRAVVAYYPVTDFEHWLNDPSYGTFRRMVFWFIRRHFKKVSGASSDEDFSRILEMASPLAQAESISAPVLLIHGTRDRSAPIEESRRMERRLRELGRDVRLLEVDGAGHVFNFKEGDADQARRAWDETLRWLDAHMSR
ncbi:MAG: prolyl oligopeptidase family serine peptidase [Acidobacteriota bacterium]